MFFVSLKANDSIIYITILSTTSQKECGIWAVGSQNYLRNNTQMLLDFSLCWHLHWWLKLLAPYHAREWHHTVLVVIVFNTLPSLLEKDLTKWVSFTNVLDEAGKINFIKSQLLDIHLLRVLCDEMGSTLKAFLLHMDVQWLPWGKALMQLAAF